MTHQIIALPEQLVAVNRALAEAPTYAEVLAIEVRTLQGADQDRQMKHAVQVISKMDDIAFSSYVGRLASAMGIQISQLKRMVKAATNKKDDDGDNYEPTLGGWIKGWLVEYMYDPDDNTASLAWRDPTGKIDSGRTVTIDGKKYGAMEPNATISSGAILFPSALGKPHKTSELTTMIEGFINRSYLLENKLYAKIMSYYVLLTWMYDSFPAIPYLRVTGEPGSGKSELMLRISLMCYRRYVASGASSSASMFRMVDKYKGTVFMDEMDLQKSDASADIVKFLVQGSMKDGAPIIRCEEVTVDGVKEIQEVIFPVYCPKLLAMQLDFADKAVASRCITFAIQARETYELVNNQIPLSINQKMRDEAKTMRNLLLRYRLENWQPNREINPAYYNLNISARLNQVTVAIQMLAEDDPALQREINQFMEEYYRFLVQDKNMTIEARILEAMWQIYLNPGMKTQYVEKEADGREKIKVGHIAKRANDIIRTMNMEEDEADDQAKGSKNDKYEISPQKAGHRLREKLQMEISPRSKDGYAVYWDQAKMEAKSKMYGVIPEDQIFPDVIKTKLPEAKQGELPASGA